MDTETFKHFKYEIALGAAIPMPEPKIDYHPHSQFSVQQFLHTVCKQHIGSLGKRGTEWEFGEDAPAGVRLGSRPDIVQLLDYAEELGIIEPQHSDAVSNGTETGVFVPYQLSKAYWDKFDKFQL
jgi:hypothetical protein